MRVLNVRSYVIISLLSFFFSPISGSGPPVWLKFFPPLARLTHRKRNQCRWKAFKREKEYPCQGGNGSGGRGNILAWCENRRTFGILMSIHRFHTSETGLLKGIFFTSWTWDGLLQACQTWSSLGKTFHVQHQRRPKCRKHYISEQKHHWGRVCTNGTQGKGFGLDSVSRIGVQWQAQIDNLLSRIKRAAGSEQCWRPAANQRVRASIDRMMDASVSWRLSGPMSRHDFDDAESVINERTQMMKGACKRKTRDTVHTKHVSTDADLERKPIGRTDRPGIMDASGGCMAVCLTMFPMASDCISKATGNVLRVWGRFMIHAQTRSRTRNGIWRASPGNHQARF